MALTDDLVSYYKLDETSGNRADSHGANTLTDNNTVGYGTGKISNASDHIRTNNEYFDATASWFGNAWTVSGWFNTDGIPPATGQTLWSFRPASGSVNLIQLEVGNAHTPRLIAFDSTGTVKKDYTCSQTITDGVFKHIVVTWDGTNMKVYFDGTEDTSITKTIDLAMTQTSTSRTLRIGAEVSASNIWDGLIDEYGIWSRAITSTEVTSLYNGGSALAYPLSITTNVTVSPSVLTATFSTPSRTVTGDLQPNNISATFTIPTYTVVDQRNVSTSVGLLTGTFTIPAYALQADFWNDKYVASSTTWADKF